MLIREKNRKLTISIFEKDFAILETVYASGPCTAEKVHRLLDEKSDLLQIMRRMHILVDRGLLERIVLDKQRLYKVKSNYKTIIRTYLKVTHNV